MAAATSWGSGTWASVSWSLRGPAPHGWRQPQAPPAGELVYNGTHGDTCYYVNCSLECNLEFFNWSCPSTPTTQPPTTPSVPATSKPLPACPDFDPPRQVCGQLLSLGTGHVWHPVLPFSWSPGGPAPCTPHTTSSRAKASGSLLGEGSAGPPWPSPPRPLARVGGWLPCWTGLPLAFSLLGGL